jgi:hypothetical protein
MEKEGCVIIASVANGEPVVIHLQLHVSTTCDPHSWLEELL